ncbi:uncharacterized protein LOC115598540 [Calypte anna]|uniref:uncharacterized protein LOC115598540 n=1 Tax=Calypte anna TaxID=9244 RepID=UPI0011C49036|nr:uncharacterized protein LOC115598540 [Calypte anna]
MTPGAARRQLSPPDSRSAARAAAAAVARNKSSPALRRPDRREDTQSPGRQGRGLQPPSPEPHARPSLHPVARAAGPLPGPALSLLRWEEGSKAPTTQRGTWGCRSFRGSRRFGRGHPLKGQAPATAAPECLKVTEPRGPTAPGEVSRPVSFPLLGGHTPMPLELRPSGSSSSSPGRAVGWLWRCSSSCTPAGLVPPCPASPCLALPCASLRPRSSSFRTLGSHGGGEDGHASFASPCFPPMERSAGYRYIHCTNTHIMNALIYH